MQVQVVVNADRGVIAGIFNCVLPDLSQGMGTIRPLS
jgi:hypothetical protein